MEAGKKIYQTPTLTVHGDVRVLTETGGSNGNGFGLSGNPGSKKDWDNKWDDWKDKWDDWKDKWR